ncbi:short-chain dehydrogenase reductase sdr [Colletotrichum asianum]
MVQEQDASEGLAQWYIHPACSGCHVTKLGSLSPQISRAQGLWCHEHSMSDDFATEAFALLGVGLGVIALRTYARISAVGVRHLQADDYLMLLVACTYSAETALAYSVGAYWQGLANNGMTDEQRRNLDPNSEEYRIRVNGSKTQIAGWITYSCLVLWPAKAAMCTFFLRLTEGLHNFQKRIYGGFALIVVTWLTVFFSIIFSCFPTHKNWQIYPDPGNTCQPAISKVNILVTVVLNVLTDLYLMSIPIPMLWFSKLPLRKKLGLIVLFSGGIFVTMAGILRCVLIISDPVNGASQAGSWAVRETFVAVVTTNVPMIFPLIRRWFSPIFGTVVSTLPLSNTNNKYGSKGPNLPQPGSIKLDDVPDSKNRKKGRQPFSQYPITEITGTGSEEHLNQPRSIPPMPTSGGISKNVEITIEESKRDSRRELDNRSEDSLERGDAYFTVDVNGGGDRGNDTKELQPGYM